MFGKTDHKSKVIEELMQYLDGKDGQDLGEAVKPKGIEVTKVEGMGEPDGDEEKPPGIEGMEPKDDAKPEMSDEELQELIEAIQSKLG